MSKWGSIIFVTVFVAIIIGAYAFSLLSPEKIEKPYLTRPKAPEIGKPLKPAQVEWVLNELGVYSLKTDQLSGEPPEIQMKITDVNQVFTIKTANGRVVATEGAASSPDLEIRATTPIAAEIFSATDVNEKILELYKNGKVGIELKKEPLKLVLKGYKSIYDALQEK